MRPLLSLVAILKDEAKTVSKTLASARDHVDRWVILDTGSRDGTQGIVKNAMRDKPGVLLEDSFTDYSMARNRTLDGESVAVFTLSMSADETLEGGPALRQFLEAHRDAPDGAYCVTMRSANTTWPYSRILRTDAKWRYSGDVHERPVSPDGKDVLAPIIPGVRIIHEESDVIRKVKRLREFDLPMLTKKVEDESKSLTDRARNMYFLAQTHAILAAECKDEPGGPKLSHNMAAMALYFRYAQLAENPENSAFDRNKAMYGYFLYFHIAEHVGLMSSQAIVDGLQVVAQAAPHMPGPRVLLAKHAAKLDPRQGLFLAEEAARVSREARENPTYEENDERFEWLSWTIATSCALSLGKTEKAKDYAKRAIAAGAKKDQFKELL